MKAQFIFILILSLTNSLLPTEPETITFSNETIETTGDAAEIIGTEVRLKKSKSYILTGNKDEGNIQVTISDVDIILKNLTLSSKKTAPILVNSNLKNISIITEENSTLKDLEDAQTKQGEKSVIKVALKSKY